MDSSAREPLASRNVAAVGDDSSARGRAAKQGRQIVIVDVNEDAVFAPLDLDPDLGSGISEEDWESARRACWGELVRARRGIWEAPAWVCERDDVVGLVIVEGMLCRELALRDRHMFELLGPRDVVQLQTLGGRWRLGGDVRFTAATETLLVVLGSSFILAAGRWPCLLVTVQRRLEEQRVRLALQGLIAHLPRVEDRVLLALWHLAEQWGRVTSDGTELPLVITHDLLGELTRSRRSTVTMAVSSLESEGLIGRLDDGKWLLMQIAERELEAIAATSKSGHSVGESFMLRQLIGQTRAEAAALHGEAREILAHDRRSSATATPDPHHPSIHLTDRRQQAAGRAESAGDAAQVAQARAAEAHARAAKAHARTAEAHEENAYLHDHAAKLATDLGNATDAVRHEGLAVRAREEARRARRAAAEEASRA